MKTQDRKFIISSFLLWRSLLFLLLFVGTIVLPYHTDFSYIHFLRYLPPNSPVASSLLYPWANFDGVHYLLIAIQGYTNNFQFFPLFPAVIHMFLFGGNATVAFFAGLILSNGAFFASLFSFYMLLRRDYKEKQNKRIILHLLVFPTAFFWCFSHGVILWHSFASYN